VLETVGAEGIMLLVFVHMKRACSFVAFEQEANAKSGDDELVHVGKLLIASFN
jgi:hypothetical protein